MVVSICIIICKIFLFVARAAVHQPSCIIGTMADFMCQKPFYEIPFGGFLCKLGEPSILVSIHRSKALIPSEAPS